MQRNSAKYHLILSTNEAAKIKTGESLIKSTNCEKLLGVKIDSKFSLGNHIKTICKKARSKLWALVSPYMTILTLWLYCLIRVTPYMATEKKKVLVNSFFDSQFNYCPLVWMYHSRRNNTKINNLHERCFQPIYSDKKWSYDKLLKKDG